MRNHKEHLSEQREKEKEKKGDKFKFLVKEIAIRQKE